MKLHDLFEDASADIDANTKASTIVTNFIRWLAEANEDAPIKDIMKRYTTRLGDYYAVCADQFGGPDDLYIGFLKSLNQEKGFHSRATIDGRPVRFVTLTLQEDPANEIDVAYGIGSDQRSFLIHELTHYFDHHRTKKYIIGVGSGNGDAQYFNSPLEFNAFFQQGAYHILDNVRSRGFNIKSIRDFDTFLTNNLVNFDSGFRYHLSDANKKKFYRRLFKLWEYIKDNVQQLAS